MNSANGYKDVEEMQKKAIVVRKCKSHRIGIAVFAILMFVILTVIILSLHSAAALLLYIAPIIILVPLILYYLTWNIRFEEKVIVKRVFFSEISRFYYSELREAVKRYYTSERNFTIRMHFSNGKTLQFRMDDENAEKAVKTLHKHCNIKTS